MKLKAKLNLNTRLFNKHLKLKYSKKVFSRTVPAQAKNLLPVQHPSKATNFWGGELQRQRIGIPSSSANPQ